MSQDSPGFQGWIRGSLLLAVVSAHAGAAAASTFTVNPTQIMLSAKTTSQTLVIHNQSDQPLRFQLSVFKWDQNDRGEMLLSPTDDIVFFPTLLTLGPGEERRVRVGMVTSLAAAEKTYRLFVEELPPLQRGPSQARGVTVLTKMGLPIFLQPSQRTFTGHLGQLGMRDGTLNFIVQNAGTVHFVPDTVLVRAFDTSGQAILERHLGGWYVLAGRSQQYELQVPQPECAKVAALSVEVRTGQSSLLERLQTPAGACAR